MIQVKDLFQKYSEVPSSTKITNKDNDKIIILRTGLGWMTNLKANDEYHPYYPMSAIDLNVIMNAWLDPNSQIQDPLGSIDGVKMTEGEIIESILKE